MKQKWVLEVGDKFKVVSEKPDSEDWNSDGDMDEWLGKIMTARIVGAYPDEWLPTEYKASEDIEEFKGDGWHWNNEFIDWEETIKLNQEVTK